MHGIPSGWVSAPASVSAAMRHKGEGLNYAFADGSARFILAQEAYNPITTGAIVFRWAVAGLMYNNGSVEGRYLDHP